MVEHEDALGDPDQVEELKRYRVATRRLRAALRVFGEAYPGRETRALRKPLAVLAAKVGRVRDVDVRLEELDRWASARREGAAEAVAPFRFALESERRAAASRLARKIHRRRHERLLADLVRFVTEPRGEPGLGDPVPERLTRDRIASSIWAAYEHVRAYSTAVRWADVPTLHALRIEAKRLRYTIEFLGDVLGPDRDWLVERLVALQDHLGALNDADLAVAAVRSFLARHDPDLAGDQRAAIADYLDDREGERDRLRRSVGPIWRPVSSATFARRLGRAVVGRPERESSSG
jgi:CHAD domain-containing protein